MHVPTRKRRSVSSMMRFRTGMPKAFMRTLSFSCMCGEKSTKDATRVQVILLRNAFPCDRRSSRNRMRSLLAQHLFKMFGFQTVSGADDARILLCERLSRNHILHDENGGTENRAPFIAR